MSNDTETVPMAEHLKVTLAFQEAITDLQVTLAAIAEENTSLKHTLDNYKRRMDIIREAAK